MNDIVRVISRLEQQRATIDRAISALREVEALKPAEAAAVAAPGKPKKRRMSAAGRRRIAEAARRRWAEKRAAEAPQPSKPAAKAKTSGGKKYKAKSTGPKKTAPVAA